MKQHRVLFSLVIAIALALSARAAIDYLRLPSAFDGNQVFARTKPGYVCARVLAASTAETNAVPSGATKVFFAATGNFFARPDGTVTVPSADVTDGTAGEINPTVWDVSGVTNIMVIADSAITVTLSFYK